MSRMCSEAGLLLELSLSIIGRRRTPSSLATIFGVQCNHPARSHGWSTLSSYAWLLLGLSQPATCAPADIAHNCFGMAPYQREQPDTGCSLETGTPTGSVREI